MNEKKRQPLKVYFDGGCRPNPGAMEIAVVMRGVADIRRGLGHGDNGAAEWRALLYALERAAQQDERDIILIGDSLSVVRQARGDLSCPPAWRTRLHEAIQPFERVRFRHVKRAQNLAGIALEKARWATG